MRSLHLGSDFTIPASGLIAIINIEKEATAELNEFMANAALDQKLIHISDNDKRKTLLVCEEYCYTSPISSAALSRRAHSEQF